MVKVIVDYRERGSDVLEELLEYEATIEVRKLDIGDYVLSNRVVVERKSMDDFMKSVIDGRIFTQAENLKRYERPIILVTGCRPGLMERQFVGAVSSLIVDFGIPVLFMKPDLAAQFIYRTARREQEGGRNPSLRRMKPKGLAEKQIYFVAGLPGVNSVLAERILEEFGSPMAFFSSREKGRVRGLGWKKIKSIEEILNSNYFKG